MRLNTSKRKAIALIAVAFVLVFLYGLIRLIIMGVSLQSTYSKLASVQSSVTAGKLSSVSSALDSAVSASAAAASAANDPIVQTWNWIPFLGADVQALEVVSRDGHSVLQAAQQVFQNLNTIKQVGGTLRGAQVLTLRDNVVALNAALQTANADFVGINPSALHFGLDSKFATAKKLIGKTSTALDAATPMVKIGAAMLSGGSTQKWFIATQNLAEARGLGGIIGAYAVVSVTDGKFKLVQAGSDQDLNAMHTLSQGSYPSDLAQLFGIDLTVIQDVNASAHAPRAAQQIYDAWKRATGQSLDGVIFVGQGTVAHLAAATGAISVGGNTLTGSNIADFLAKGIYAKYPDVATKNAVVTQVMAALFSNLTSKPINTTALFSSLASGANADRLMAWSSHSETQASLVAEDVAGFVSPLMGPVTQVTVNNAGGNKLEAYAHVSVAYTQGDCGQMTFDGYYARKSTVVVRVKNAAPTSGLPAYVTTRLDDNFGIAPRPKGSNRELISVYGPVGSDGVSFSVNGQKYYAASALDQNHPVWVFDIELQPGETKTLKVNFVEPIADQNSVVFTAAPRLIAPIMFNPVASYVHAGPQCSAHK